MSYFIKRPTKNNGRATYALVNPQGKTIADERIERLNKDLKRGISIDILETRVKQILLSFRNNANTELTQIDNQKLVSSYIKYQLPRKKRRAPEAFINEINRAARIIDPLSILTTSQEELQKHLDKKLAHKPTVHRKTAQTLNQLLKFADRTISLAKEERPIHDIVYITLETFLNELIKIPEPYKSALGTAFATGARFGEIFSIIIKRDDLAGIYSQWKVKNKTIIKTPPKSHARDAFIIPELLPFVKSWLTVSNEQKTEIRIYRRRLWALTKKIWGIRFHDLRHSYAIHLATAGGFGKEDLSNALGISEAVVVIHYSNYIANNSQADRWSTMYKKAKE